MGRTIRRAERKREEIVIIKKHWVRVDLDCMLGEVLMHPGYVVPGIPMMYIVSRASDFYSTFLERTKGRLLVLNPIV